MSERDHQPETESHEAEESATGRREFLTRSGALLALLGAAGVLNTDALGQDNVRVAPGAIRAKQLDQRQVKNLQSTLQEAITKRDTSVLQRPNSVLPAEVSAALARLTQEDLDDAARLHSKLSDLQNKLRDNNGVIGM